MFGCRRERREAGRERHGRGGFAAGPEGAQQLMAFVERQLGITEGQREAWERLSEAVRDSAEALQIARAAVDETEARALARLARFEAVAEAASAALRRIRPALEALYRTLDDAQRQALDELFAHGHPRPHGAGV